MNFATSVLPRYKFINRFEGGVQWYMMLSRDFNSSINFKLKNGKGPLVSFNGQSNTLRLSIKEI